LRFILIKYFAKALVKSPKGTKCQGLRLGFTLLGRQPRPISHFPFPISACPKWRRPQLRGQLSLLQFGVIIGINKRHQSGSKCDFKAVGGEKRNGQPLSPDQAQTKLKDFPQSGKVCLTRSGNSAGERGLNYEQHTGKVQRGCLDSIVAISLALELK